MSEEISRFIQFWNRRRDALNKARREKYQDDPEHRESVKAAARKRHKPAGTVGRPRGSRNRPQHIIIDGQAVVLIGLGEAATRLGVSKEALRGYDDRGVIPRNRQMDQLGRRWFPEAFIEFLKPLLVDQRLRKDPLWRLKGRVEAAWTQPLTAGIPRLPEEKQQHGEEADGRLDDDGRSDAIDS